MGRFWRWHFAFSAYCRLQGWNKLADKWKSDYEPNAVKMLSELAEAFGDDYPTKKLIEKWIDDEKDYIAWGCQYLNYIEKLGYENFLTAMMKGWVKSSFAAVAIVGHASKRDSSG